jgi:hypothetical protein
LDIRCGTYIMNFEWFLWLKIQINYKLKHALEGRINWVTSSHLQVYHSIQLRILFIFDFSKIGHIYLAKQCSYVEFTTFCNSFTFGPMTHATLKIQEKSIILKKNCISGSIYTLGQLHKPHYSIYARKLFVYFGFVPHIEISQTGVL